MVRSPQLIVCAEVTAGSCADVAVTVSDSPIVATMAFRSISVRRDRPLAIGLQRLQADQAPAGAVVTQALQIEHERRALAVHHRL